MGWGLMPAPRHPPQPALPITQQAAQRQPCARFPGLPQRRIRRRAAGASGSVAIGWDQVLPGPFRWVPGRGATLSKRAVNAALNGPWPHQDT